MKILTSLIFTSLLLAASPSFADNCEQAAYFYNKGQYRSALTILKPLVKKGEACAEYYMGVMYRRGQGVKQNSTKGIALLESAQSKGSQEAKNFLDSDH